MRDNAPFQAFLQRVRPSLDYDRRFAEEIQKDPVVLGFLVSAQGERSGVLPRPAFAATALANAEYRYFSAHGYSGNIAPLQAVATAAGHLYQALDPDGVTRSVPMFMQVGDGFFEAMSLAVLRVYLGNAPIKVETTIVDAGSAGSAADQSATLSLPRPAQTIAATAAPNSVTCAFVVSTLMSSAGVSEATTGEPSRSPSTSGRMPSGSLKNVASCRVTTSRRPDPTAARSGW